MKINFLPRFQMEPVTGLATAGIIAAGANLAGQGVNAYMTGKTNLKTRQFAEEMYFRQRADALADWNMQNAYNSPAAQMKRFKDAGLNPHLIYGQQSQGATVRSSEAQPYRPQAPQFDLGSVMNSYFNTQQTIQNIVNAQAMEKILDMKARLGESQIDLNELKSKSLGVQISTDTALQPLKIQKAQIDNLMQSQNISESEARTRVLEAQKAESILRQQALTIENAYKISQEEMKLALGQSTLLQGAEAILKSKAERLLIAANEAKTKEETNNLKTQAVILNRQAEEMRKRGIMTDYDLMRSERGYQTGDNALNQYLKEFKEKVKSSMGDYDQPDGTRVRSSSGKKYKASFH